MCRLVLSVYLSVLFFVIIAIVIAVIVVVIVNAGASVGTIADISATPHEPAGQFAPCTERVSAELQC